MRLKIVEMVIISKINYCIKQTNGARVRVTMNQIMSQEVYDMLQHELANDKFQSLFGALDIPRFSFNIKIDGVTLLPYNIEALNKGGFADVVAQDVNQHEQCVISMDQDLKFSNKHLKLYQAALLAIASPLIVAEGLVVGVVGRTGWLLYQTGKATHHRGMKRVFAAEEY